MTFAEELQSARILLSRLGITVNYTGFAYTAYAVALSVRDPRRLQLVTKWLYPDVAAHYGTTAMCVERNIRTVSGLSWERNPALLSEIAKCTLSGKPGNATFLAILAAYLSCGDRSGF